MISIETAVLISKQLLEAQGFGAGSYVKTSGELRVFDLITADAPVLFDVGGHVGEYTEEFLRRFPRGRSYIFEPSANHLALLRQRLAGRPEVQIFPVGLGTEPGQVPLYKDQDVSGLASFSKRRLQYLGIEMEQVGIVTITTLDTIVEEIGLTGVDLLKIDVEGHDLAVLRGASRAMERGVIKLVQFEFGGCNLDSRTNLQDFFYFFEAYDFAIGVIQPANRIHLLDRYDEFFEHYRTTNFVAAPGAVLAN
jgi:FkbM family methyltransferase